MTAVSPRPRKTPEVEAIEDHWQIVRLRIAQDLAERRMSLQQTGTKSPAEIVAECSQSFRAFLPWWRFRNRDTAGRNDSTLSFAKLWKGQDLLVAAMEGDVEHIQRFDSPEPWFHAFRQALERQAEGGNYPNGPWLFMLKAGKLGFTELECAYDAWVALYRSPNARVHLFSRDLPAAKELLRMVRFGLMHLPPWFGVKIPKDEADADTTTSIRLSMRRDDERIIKSYATGENISIDQVAHHVHLDEWAHMKISKKGIWEDVQTTVAPDGTLHIVTRGAGDDADVRETWEAAERGDHELVPFFAPWHWRDDRDQNWYSIQAGKNTVVGLSHFAPDNPQDALAGDADNDYIPIVLWDACRDPDMPPLMPDPRGEALVIALDAAVSGDSFAVVGATRHPVRHEDPAIRAVKVWRPDQFPDGRINFRTVEGWIRVACQGGCPGDPSNAIEAHPLYPAGVAVPPEWNQRPDCGACQANVRMPPFNVVKLVYDPSQLEDMMQRFRHDGVVTVGAFDQGKKRLIADRGLFDQVIQRRLAHNGDPLLREHVGNARAKLQAGQDSTMRIVKKDDKRRVDAVVAASMATDEVLRLYL